MGAEAIGAEINRTKEQVYELYRQGIFGDAVFKTGHKTFAARRQRLRELTPGKEKSAS